MAVLGTEVQKEEIVRKKSIQTPGRVAQVNILGNRLRIYGKPTLGKTVARKAGVTRTSPNVIAINEAMAALKPASNCKGKHFYDRSFQRCLREQLKNIKEKAAAKLAGATGG
jgi:predicted metal-dependent hydrolase